MCPIRILRKGQPGVPSNASRCRQRCPISGGRARHRRRALPPCAAASPPAEALSRVCALAPASCHLVPLSRAAEMTTPRGPEYGREMVSAPSGPRPGCVGSTRLEAADPPPPPTLPSVPSPWRAGPASCPGSEALAELGDRGRTRRPHRGRSGLGAWWTRWEDLTNNVESDLVQRLQLGPGRDPSCAAARGGRGGGATAPATLWSAGLCLHLRAGSDRMGNVCACREDVN